MRAYLLFPVTLLILPALLLGQTSSLWIEEDSGAWNVDTNWDNDAPGSGDEAIFGDGTVPSDLITITVDEGRTVRDLTFEPGIRHAFDGEALSLEHEGLLFGRVAGATQIGEPVVFDNALIFLPEGNTDDGLYTMNFRTGSAAPFVFNGGWSAGETTGTVTVRIEGQGTGSTLMNATLAGTISDGTNSTLALEIDAGESGFSTAVGTLRIEGDNTFSGGTVVHSGNVTVASNTAFGTGDLVWNEGFWDGDGNRTISNALFLNGLLRQQGGTPTFTGPVTLGGSGAELVGGITFDGKISGPDTAPIDHTDRGTVRFNNPDSDFEGGIIFGDTSSAIELRVTATTTGTPLGTGTLTIRGGNSETNARFNGALGTISNNLVWDGQVYFASAGGTFSGNMVLGTDAARQPGLGTNNQTLVFSGNISDGGEGKHLLIQSHGTFEFSGDSSFTTGIVLQNRNPFGNNETASNQTLRIGSDTALGTGPIVFLGTIGTGKQRIEQSSGSNPLTIGNPLTINGDLVINNWDGWTFTGPVTFGNDDALTPTLAVETGGVAVFTGAFDNSPNDKDLVKLGGGTLVLAGTSSALSGTVQINAGTLRLGNNGTTGTVGSATLAVASGATLGLSRSDLATYANTITGEGNLSVTGSGEVTLTGTLDYEGTTTIASGATLRVNTTHSGGGEYSVFGTLGGTGTLSLIEDGDPPVIHSVVVKPGGFVAPGTASTPGTLNLLNATLDVDEIFGQGLGSLVFRLGSVSDRIDLNGNWLWLTPDTGEGLIFDDFDFIAGTGFGGGTYTLIEDFLSFGDILADSGTEGFVNGIESWLEIQGSDLVLQVIPEPATVALLLGSLALGLAVWRRRTRAQVRG